MDTSTDQASDLRSRDGSVHVTDERINTVTHLVASCFALVGAALLVVRASLEGDPWTIVGGVPARPIGERPREQHYRIDYGPERY